MKFLLAEPEAPWLRRLVANPIFDKTAAVILVAWVTYSSIIAIQKNLGFALNLLFASVILLNLLALIRHNPKRVSLNPWFWLLTMAASFHVALYGLFLSEEAPSLAPHWFNNGLAVAGLGMTVVGRFALGLNFGFVPAQRELVTSGAFRYVRHPIYTGLCMLLLARFTEHASLASFILTATGIGLWVLKALSEEVFLSQDPEYARYMKKTPWRLFPYIF